MSAWKTVVLTEHRATSSKVKAEGIGVVEAMVARVQDVAMRDEMKYDFVRVIRQRFCFGKR